jgi:hypothetical protein
LLTVMVSIRLFDLFCAGTQLSLHGGVWKT